MSTNFFDFFDVFRLVIHRTSTDFDIHRCTRVGGGGKCTFFPKNKNAIKPLNKGFPWNFSQIIDPLPIRKKHPYPPLDFQPKCFYVELLTSQDVFLRKRQLLKFSHFRFFFLKFCFSPNFCQMSKFLVCICKQMPRGL